MRWRPTEMMITAAALSLPYLCSAAPMQRDPQAVEDCTRGLTAPREVHLGRNGAVTAVAMFDVAGSQRLELFVTIRDLQGVILRQIVCFYDSNNQVARAHRPFPAEETQWVWE